MAGGPSILLSIALGFCALNSSPLAAADKKADEAKSTVSEANAARELSVAAVAEAARDSVVIVKHSGRNEREDGTGSGFVISENGLIATSLHVIGEARPITVRMANGRVYDVVGIHAWDRKLDLAIIRIDAKQLRALTLGNSETLRQGTSVVAMGNPLGLEHSVVQGVVSAKRSFDGVEMIQLAIPIEQGNSGGPLLDLQGRVHGILTMKSALSDNLGFAMPVNALKLLLDKPNPVPMSRWLTIGALQPREWLPLLGARWRQRAGRIEVDGFGTGFGGRSLCLWQKPAPPRAFEVAVTVRLDDEAGAAGLIFESDGGQKHYGFYPSAGQLRLTRFDGPNVFSWTILKQIESPHYRPGEWNRLRVRLEKKGFRCYVNDHLVIESDDDQLTRGQVGLAKFRNTKAWFKDFEIGPDLALSASARNRNAEAIAELVRKIQNHSGKPDAELLAALRRDPAVSQNLLAEEARKLEQRASQLRQLAITTHRQAVKAELIEALSAPEEKIDLFSAALLIAKFDNPELEIGPYRRQLDEMADDVVRKLPANADAARRLEGLKEYLFTENGFHGSRTDYYNKANSYMSDLLDDREGLPITLSVLFMELGRRVGIDGVLGVPLPGHFVVKWVRPDAPDELLDVYEGGKVLTRAEARERVVAGGRAWQDEYLNAATKREIIVRMLRNLLGIARERDPETEVLRYVDLIVSLTPDASRERLERAMLRLRAGDKPGAKEDLKWILDHAPPEVDVKRVTELYDSL